MWEVTCAGEYRTLVRDATVGRSYWCAAIGQQGRLLAVGMEDGVALWDLKIAAFLTCLPIGVTYGVAFDHSTPPALLTNGPSGAYRWPVRDGPQSSRLLVGPPQKLVLSGTSAQIAVSRDDRIVAQAAVGSGGRLLWPDSGRVVPLAGHRDARYISISPDGRWVATGTHNGVGARIWDADSGKQVRELIPKAGTWGVEFSGDGQWLATQIPSCQLWKVGSWEKTRQFAGTQFGFAPDGKVLAVETGAGAVRLLEPASGLEFGRLANPYQDKAFRICFSPDGVFLVTLGWDPYPIHVWDLRKIRGRLKELDLDWDLPPYAPQNPAWSDGPLQLQIDLGPFSSPPR